MSLEEELQMATSTVDINVTEPTTNEVQVSTETVIQKIEPNLSEIAEEVKMTSYAPVGQPANVAMPTQPIQNPQFMSANMGQAPLPQNMGQPTHIYNNPINTNPYQNNVTTAPYQNNVQPMAQGFDMNQQVQETEVTYASKTVEFGEPASTRAIENLKKLDPGSQIRFTLLDIPNEVRFVHKVETSYGATKVVCWSNQEKGIVGACCKDSEAKPRYFFPIMVYPTVPGNINMPNTNGVPEIRLMIIWDYAVVQSLKACIQAVGGDYTKADIIASGIDNFGKMQFFPAQGCFREQYSNQVNSLHNYWLQNKGNINGNFGRLLNDQKYYNLTKAAQQPVPQMQNYGVSDIY